MKINIRVYDKTYYAEYDENKKEGYIMIDGFKHLIRADNEKEFIKYSKYAVLSIIDKRSKFFRDSIKDVGES